MDDDYIYGPHYIVKHMVDFPKMVFELTDEANQPIEDSKFDMFHLYVTKEPGGRILTHSLVFHVKSKPGFWRLNYDPLRIPPGEYLMEVHGQQDQKITRVWPQQGYFKLTVLPTLVKIPE